MYRITQKRGYAGLTEQMRRTLAALGLRKPGMVVVKEDIPAIRGMIRKVSHLLTVEVLQTKS
ncbi:MAG: 50S ribosomal protein L30 [Nitrospirae bacterium]|nr:50S ribosomal protein L30 [Nitrospirota bacterium]MBF0534278.1 50S ribosomal protein L30 [Nitrospirota bacterium]MBF0615741.1 50S ribosomal protein L30 [Nitrospirota bacterium]